MGHKTMSFDLSDYVDVKARLTLALNKYPELSVVEDAPEIVTIGEKTFIQCAVTVFRNPTDPLPVRAFCWEVFPGRTPYTKDSEQPNGSTSALGRALGFMGFGIERAVSSRDEVRTARDNNPQPAREPRPEARKLSGMATTSQLSLIRQMSAERGVIFENLDQMTFADAQAEITRLKGLPKL